MLTAPRSGALPSPPDRGRAPHPALRRPANAQGALVSRPTTTRMRPAPTLAAGGGRPATSAAHAPSPTSTICADALHPSMRPGQEEGNATREHMLLPGHPPQSPARFAQLQTAPDARRTARVSKWGAWTCQRGAQRSLLHSNQLVRRPTSSLREPAVLRRFRPDAKARRTRAEPGPAVCIGHDTATLLVYPAPLDEPSAPTTNEAPAAGSRRGGGGPGKPLPHSAELPTTTSKTDFAGSRRHGAHPAHEREAADVPRTTRADAAEKQGPGSPPRASGPAPSPHTNPAGSSSTRRRDGPREAPRGGDRRAPDR